MGKADSADLLGRANSQIEGESYDELQERVVVVFLECSVCSALDCLRRAQRTDGPRSKQEGYSGSARATYLERGETVETRQRKVAHDEIGRPIAECVHQARLIVDHARLEGHTAFLEGMRSEENVFDAIFDEQQSQGLRHHG